MVKSEKIFLGTDSKACYGFLISGCDSSINEATFNEKLLIYHYTIGLLKITYGQL